MDYKQAHKNQPSMRAGGSSGRRGHSGVCAGAGLAGCCCRAPNGHHDHDEGVGVDVGAGGGDGGGGIVGKGSSTNTHPSYANVGKSHTCAVAANIGFIAALDESMSGVRIDEQKHNAEFIKPTSSQQRWALLVLGSKYGKLAHPASRILANALTVHTRSLARWISNSEGRLTYPPPVGCGCDTDGGGGGGGGGERAMYGEHCQPPRMTRPLHTFGASLNILCQFAGNSFKISRTRRSFSQKHKRSLSLSSASQHCGAIRELSTELSSPMAEHPAWMSDIKPSTSHVLLTGADMYAGERIAVGGLDGGADGGVNGGGGDDSDSGGDGTGSIVNLGIGVHSLPILMAMPQRRSAAEIVTGITLCLTSNATSPMFLLQKHSSAFSSLSSAQHASRLKLFEFESHNLSIGAKLSPAHSGTNVSRCAFAPNAIFDSMTTKSVVLRTHRMLYVMTLPPTYY